MGKVNEHGRNLARWADSKREGTPPKPAATVVLLRDREAGLETLMLRRNSKIAFGGMWVFPGGRVDPADSEGRDEIGAARSAAVREALEEAGLRLDERDLVPYSHWTPPAITPKRYFTWFFIARAPDAAVSIDGGEIHEHQWMRPGDALLRRDQGEIELAPPTFVTLFELAKCAGVEAALAESRGREPERFQTAIGRAPSGAVAMWHGDAGYADAEPERPGPRHRLWMLDEGWRYERD